MVHMHSLLVEVRVHVCFICVSQVLGAVLGVGVCMYACAYTYAFFVSESASTHVFHMCFIGAWCQCVCVCVCVCVCMDVGTCMCAFMHTSAGYICIFVRGSASAHVFHMCFISACVHAHAHIQTDRHINTHSSTKHL
jgi:hypothetical protein